ALGGLNHAVMEDAGMGPDAPAPAGRVPTTKGLPEALHSGAAVVTGYPLEAHNGRCDPAELLQRAEQIVLQDRLLTLFTDCGDTARRSVGQLAQGSVERVDGLLSAIAPAEPKNP